MKCFVCGSEATLKDYAQIGFCSMEHLKQNYIQNIDSVIEYQQFNGDIQEVEHE